jgi:hypothetical protein
MKITIEFVDNVPEIYFDKELLKLDGDEFFAVMQDAIMFLQSIMTDQYPDPTSPD